MLLIGKDVAFMPARAMTLLSKNNDAFVPAQNHH